MSEEILTRMSAATSDLVRRSCDFGKMIHRAPALVAFPESVEDVSNTVRWALNAGARVAIRGGGHSQGGQCLSEGGVVIDMAKLDRIEILGPDLIRVQGGTRWSGVIDALRGAGRLPYVLADTPEVTVGGTLSAGGIGSTSLHFGAQVGHIERLEVVTGTGDRLRCSRTRNIDLFNAVRSGQGQFGIITEAWIRLRKTGRKVGDYALRYNDYDRFASDFEWIAENRQFAHMRARLNLHERCIWLNPGVEYDEDFDEDAILTGLGYDECVFQGEVDTEDAFMFPKGTFPRSCYFPWRDFFLPWEIFPMALDQPWLGSDWKARSPCDWTGIYLIDTRTIDAPLFMHPPGERILGYSILPVMGSFNFARECAIQLEKIDRRIIELGGKAYVSGHVGYGEDEWKKHYGDKYELGIRLKREFDPNRIFHWQGMPF